VPPHSQRRAPVIPTNPPVRIFVIKGEGSGPAGLLGGGVHGAGLLRRALQDGLPGRGVRVREHLRRQEPDRVLRRKKSVGGGVGNGVAVGPTFHHVGHNCGYGRHRTTNIRGKK